MFESFPTDNETIKVQATTVSLFTHLLFVTKKTQTKGKLVENVLKNMRFVTNV